MDQSSGKMTSCGCSPDGLASLNKDSKDKLLLDTYESSEESSGLRLDKSSSKPMRINEDDMAQKTKRCDA
nr:hypothetical protein CFP56_48902 [Quercus suber]